ncbi:MAG: endolytic transglycosylase MltG [Oscillospiraceae bacterium]
MNNNEEEKINDQENTSDDTTQNKQSAEENGENNDEVLPKFKGKEQSQKSANTFSLNYENEIPDYDFEDLDLKSIKPEKKRMKSWIKVLLIGIIIIAIAVLLSVGIMFAAQDIFGFNKPRTSVTVEIEKGAGVNSAATVLKEKGYIKSEFLFKVYYKLSKQQKTIYPGIYTELTQNMSYEILLDELSKYDSKQTAKVTFPEGYTLDQIAKELEDKKVCDAKKFIKIINETEFNVPFLKDVSTNDMKFYKMEGFVFPDTYEFFIGDNPANVAKKILDNFQTKVIDAHKEQIVASGYSLDELINFAAIVQAEAGVAEQMKMVSSVYRNRLNNASEFPKLQADPTRKYAEKIMSDMEVVNMEMVNKYNTYQGIGLPPGPICNPGIDAIIATLEPATSDYYYFCTNIKTREFFYAKNLNQHNINLRKAKLR